MIAERTIAVFRALRRRPGRWAAALALACLAGMLGTALASGGAKTPAKAPAAAAAITTSGKSGSAPAKKPADPKLFAPDHPVLLLEGLKCQIHREGEVRQDITAGTGHYDETAKVLDMDVLSVNFKDQGTTLGLVTCGAARVWMAEDLKQGIGMHDMLMHETVRLRGNDNWLLQTPEMHYTARDALLSSNKGYLKQFPLSSGFLIGQGTGIEIKLLLEKKTFEYCREFGSPAEYRKSDRAVLKP